MSQVRNYRPMAKGYWLIALLFVVLTGCKDKNSQLEDPFVIPGNTANPNWVVAANNNLPSSLTAIIKVSFAENKGILAAFIGGECCGVADYLMRPPPSPIRMMRKKEQ